MVNDYNIFAWFFTQDDGVMTEEEDEEDEVEIGAHPDAKTTHIFVGKDNTGDKNEQCCILAQLKYLSLSVVLYL